MALFFFLGGLFLTVFLLAFFIIDLVYSWRIYNNNNISSGEAIFLIIMNMFGILIVLAMVGMFLFQTFRFYRKEGLPTGPPNPKEFLDFDSNGKRKHEHKESSCGSSCYAPPSCAM